MESERNAIRSLMNSVGFRLIEEKLLEDRRGEYLYDLGREVFFKSQKNVNS